MMDFYWKRIAPGLYECRRDCELVALIERTVDSGEPIWALTVMDGTYFRPRASGAPRALDRFPSLGDAKFAYGYARRMMAERLERVEAEGTAGAADLEEIARQRPFEKIERTFTQLDTITAIWRRDHCPPVEFAHNGVRIERERAVELIGERA
jgi:hypothetical protein